MRLKAIEFGALLLIAALGCRDDDDRHVLPKHDADRAVQRAQVEADEAAARVEKLSNELAALDGRIQAETEALTQATADAERAASNDALKKLLRDKAQLIERVAAAKATAAKASAQRP